jgi:hypothetical protein
MSDLMRLRKFETLRRDVRSVARGYRDAFEASKRAPKA